MSSVKDLGSFIGGLANEQSLMKDNMSGDEEPRQLDLFSTEELVLDESGVGSGSFIVEGNEVLIWSHPVYGKWDLFKWASFKGEAFGEPEELFSL